MSGKFTAVRPRYLTVHRFAGCCYDDGKDFNAFSEAVKHLKKLQREGGLELAAVYDTYKHIVYVTFGDAMEFSERLTSPSICVVDYDYFTKFHSALGMWNKNGRITTFETQARSRSEIERYIWTIQRLPQ